VKNRKEQYNRWIFNRDKEKRMFILKNGVLNWGLGTGVLMCLFELSGLFGPVSYEKALFLIPWFMIVGAIYGNHIWKNRFP
jgi:hypothetical protein